MKTIKEFLLYLVVWMFPKNLPQDQAEAMAWAEIHRDIYQ